MGQQSKAEAKAACYLMTPARQERAKQAKLKIKGRRLPGEDKLARALRPYHGKMVTLSIMADLSWRLSTHPAEDAVYSATCDNLTSHWTEAERMLESIRRQIAERSLEDE